MPVKIMGLATCYNRKEKTVKAIEGLIGKNPGSELSFVITDDNSSDGTAEALEKYDCVTVVHGNGSSFYTGGMRLAIAKATEIINGSGTENYPDYIMLFNDDVDFYDGAIDALVSKLKKKEDAPSKVIYVGPTCEADEKTFSYGGVVRRSNFRPKFRRLKADDEAGLPVDTFNANCVLIPTGLFLRTGNMDSVYNHSLGDFDYGYMLRKKGGEIYVSDEYVGICPFNSDKGTWNDTSLSRRERFKKKESIKGVPFGEFFHYLLKNYNILTAIIYSFSPYVRILIGK